MKKLIFALFVCFSVALVPAFALFGCGGKKSGDGGEDKPDEDPVVKYSVTFVYDGGSSVSKVAEGKKVRKPEDPTVLGYDFDAWYTSNEYTAMYDFNTPVTGDITLYGALYDYKLVLSTSDEFAYVYRCDQSAARVVIPTFYQAKTVKAIGDSAFSDCHNLYEIFIPNTVTKIGDSAFVMCGLSTINLPSSICEIGDGAFSACHNLTSIEIPDGVIDISDNLFNNCLNLVTVTLPNSVRTIGAHAFLDCWDLLNFEIPYGVQTIGEYAFNCCNSLDSIEIPETVLTVERDAFAGLSGLTNVVLNEGLISIEEEAFAGCGFSQITLPESLMYIEQMAFSNCDMLESIVIPDGVETIGNGAFADCDNLVDVQIPLPNEVTWFRNVFENTEVEHVTISSGVIKLQEIVYCPSIKTITLLEGVATVGVFSLAMNEGLESVVIENGVASIGNQAFQNDEALITINIPASVKTIGYSAFEGCTLLATITIDSAEIYAAADGPLYDDAGGLLTYAEIVYVYKSVDDGSNVYLNGNFTLDTNTNPNYNIYTK